MATTTQIDGDFAFTANIANADKHVIENAIHSITKNNVSIRSDNDAVTVVPMRKPGRGKIAEILAYLDALEQPKTTASNKTNAPRRYVTSLFYAENNGLEHGRPWIPSQHQIDTGVVPPGFEGEYVCYVYGD